MSVLVSEEKPLTYEYHRDGKAYQFKYWDTDSFDDLELSKVRQVYGVCLCEGNMVIVLNGKYGTWGLVGGTREEGESIEDTIVREVKEESNTNVLSWQPIGVQQVTTSEGNIYYQLRVLCKVKPIGQFEIDPAGSITEVKVIDPSDYKNYFDWGEIGERIVQRALELV